MYQVTQLYMFLIEIIPIFLLSTPPSYLPTSLQCLPILVLKKDSLFFVTIVTYVCKYVFMYMYAKIHKTTCWVHFCCLLHVISGLTTLHWTVRDSFLREANSHSQCSHQCLHCTFSLLDTYGNTLNTLKSNSVMYIKDNISQTLRVYFSTTRVL